MQAEIDSEDALLAPLFTLGAISTIGIGTVSIFGTSLASAAVSLGATNITYGAILSVLVLAIVAITNDSMTTLSRNRGRSNRFKFSDLETLESVGLIGTSGILVGTALVPGVSDFITSSDFVGLLALVIEAIGYYTVSYAN